MNPVNKQYGLLMPKKKQSSFKVSNIFGDDSDEETPKQEINSSLQRSSLQAKIKRQTQLEIDKALEADPTVYEYDSIYDDLQATKEEKDSAVKQKKDRKPKYIAGLLKAAETRKREDERRAERKVQKERENEGGEFDDKEVFVTGAYRKKMQEMQELEEKERREAAMEDLLDVKKQKDMSGFYRYMLNQQSGGATVEDKTKEVSVKEEPDSPNQSSSGGQGEKTRSGPDISKERQSSKERNRSSSTDRGRRSSSRDRGRRSSSRDRGRRSSSRDRGRKSRDSSDDSRERQRVREKTESKDRHRKRRHSPDSPKLSRKNASDRDNRKKESSHEKQARRDKQRHRNESDSESEGPDRVRGNRSRSREEDRHDRDKNTRKEERKKSPETETKMEKKSEDKPESTEIKKSGVVSKKTTDSAASEARKRYLERKLAKERAKLNQQEG
ncbi:nuclear speckle splicing regulatory protein 1-like [Saccostrea cucullata]|uniref:nuclear speckle splicing regulatory protein 1-like n=1 Tax=Saccostrea cuccullata TaxID=36930 RepID=UPI002ED3AAE5